MKALGSSYECYVLDTHVLFPHVFLKGIPNLSRTNTLYYTCVDGIFKRKLHLIMLPSIDSEFNELILERYRNLLLDIKSEALRCKQSGVESFYYRSGGVICSKNYPNDFRAYWTANKGSFAKWLGLDERNIRREVYRLVRRVLEEYQETVRHADLIIKEWEDSRHQKESRSLCDRLRTLRDVKKTIPCDAHDEDLDIVSDCMVYCHHFMEYGILYLITNDNNCYQTVKAITDPADRRASMMDRQRFDCIRPSVLLDKLKKSS